jgi:AAA15 family ATPase/GTPase
VIILHGYWDLFYPLIRKAILTRFNNPRTNPLGSQLIVTTLSPYSISHDVSRRDQVWLIHSNREGTFQMYSLCDFRGSGRIWRRGRFPDYYLEGRTGVVPTME